MNIQKDKESTVRLSHILFKRVSSYLKNLEIRICLLLDL